MKIWRIRTPTSRTSIWCAECVACIDLAASDYRHRQRLTWSPIEINAPDTQCPASWVFNAGDPPERADSGNALVIDLFPKNEIQHLEITSLGFGQSSIERQFDQ